MAKKLKIKRLKPKRRRNIKIDSEAASVDLRKQYAANAADKLIQSNKRYTVIIASLKEGTPITEIARWFAVNGWIDVSERAFQNALYSFRNRHSQLLNSKDIDSFEALADGNSPHLDVDVELNKLLRIQRERIAIDVTTEKELGKLFNTTHKEIQVAAELLTALHKSKTGTGGNGDNLPDDLPSNVREKLRGIKADEAQRDKIYSLTQDFAKKLATEDA